MKRCKSCGACQECGAPRPVTPFYPGKDPWRQPYYPQYPSYPYRWSNTSSPNEITFTSNVTNYAA